MNTITRHEGVLFEQWTSPEIPCPCCCKPLFVELLGRPSSDSNPIMVWCANCGEEAEGATVEQAQRALALSVERQVAESYRATPEEIESFHMAHKWCSEAMV